MIKCHNLKQECSMYLHCACAIHRSDSVTMQVEMRREWTSLLVSHTQSFRCKQWAGIILTKHIPILCLIVFHMQNCTNLMVVLCSGKFDFLGLVICWTVKELPNKFVPYIELSIWSVMSCCTSTCAHACVKLATSVWTSTLWCCVSRN